LSFPPVEKNISFLIVFFSYFWHICFSIFSTKLMTSETLQDTEFQNGLRGS